MTQKTLLWITVVAVVVIAAAVAIVAFQQGGQLRTQLLQETRTCEQERVECTAGCSDASCQNDCQQTYLQCIGEGGASCPSDRPKLCVASVPGFGGNTKCCREDQECEITVVPPAGAPGNSGGVIATCDGQLEEVLPVPSS